MDDGDPPPPPEPPKKEKRVVLPKKKRVYTRQINKTKPVRTESTTNAASEDVDPDPTPRAADVNASTGSVLHRATSRNAARKPSSAELTSELKRKHDELSAALSKVSALERENESLKKRNKSLAETTERARQDLRDERKKSTVVEKEHNKRIHEVEQSAQSAEAESNKKLHELEERARNAEANAASYYSSKIEKEKERRDRQVELEKKKAAKQHASLKKQHASELSSVQEAATSTLKDKEKVIERLSDINSHNQSLATSLSQKNQQLEREKREALADARVKTSIAVANVRKESLAKSVAFTNQLKEKDDLIDGVHQMATDVASEYSSLARASNAETAALKKTADSRLLNLKQTKERESLLREKLDDVMDTYSDELTKAQAEIAMLKAMLGEKSDAVAGLESELAEAKKEIETLKPWTLQKVGNPKTWDERATQLVVELISHRTPPASVSANILSVVEILMPNASIVKELPGIRFVRYCRTILAHVSQTLAAYEIALAEVIEQSHTDGTNRRQTAFQNFVVRVLREGGSRRITLSSCILAEDESAVSIASAILKEFKHSGELLTDWREVTAKLYPDRPDLLEKIPKASELSISKLGFGSFTTTDTCSTARKLRRVLNEHIERVAKEEGFPPESIKVFTADCWQHLRNVWFGAVTGALEDELRDVLAEDLNELPDTFRIKLDIDDFFRCMEKEFGDNANYAKGHGAEFRQWKKEYHPDAYLFPLMRACGGTRQDICLEGAPAVLMNLPYYLQYLDWRISAAGGKSDAILQTKLYIMLRCTEVVALLRILSILHISICLPTRWLAGKSHELSEFNFGYYDMGKALDLMERAFESIIDNGELMLDEDFMMNELFSDIAETVDPFKTYLEYMFEEKLSNAGLSGDKVLPWDLLRAAVFYPSRADIVRSAELCHQLAVIAATSFLAEFQDTSKATHNYLSSISGKYSLATISEEQRKAGFKKEASNSISESNFASATQALKTYGTIRLDSAAAEGHARTNNTFGRAHENFINSGKNGNSEVKRGLLHQLEPELITSLFHAAKKGAPKLRKRHDDALNLLNEAKLNKLKAEQLKVTEKTEEALILAMDYYDRGISDRRWSSVEIAESVYSELASESARLKATKEQILIYKLGFGWTDCGHKWSENGYHYTSRDLLDHLIKNVIPLKRDIPSEAPINVKYGLARDYKLGTATPLQFRDERYFNVKSVAEMRQTAEEERRRRETEFETDRDASLQPNIMPKFDDSLIGFPIEYLFQYDDEHGNPFTAWCDGVIESISNVKTRMVVIKWNEKKVAEGDASTSKHKLALRKWNPKSPTPGAWRKFLGDPNA